MRAEDLVKMESITTMQLITVIGIALTAVATTLTGIVAVLKWLGERTPKHKLVFHEVLVKKSRATINNKLVPTIQLGFWLRNDAAFPIEFEIEEIRTELKNLHPSIKTYEKKKFEVSPRNYYRFEDNHIDIENIELRNQILDGCICAHLKYGRSGKLTQGLRIKRRVSATFDGEGNLLMWESL